MTYRQTTWLLAALALLLIVKLKLLPALLAGLVVYHTVHFFAARLVVTRISGKFAKIVAVALVSVLVITLLVAAILGMMALLRSESGGPAAFLGKLAEILETSRSSLPEWIYSSMPRDAEELKSHFAAWLREHSGELKILGKEAGHVFAHMLIGMIIGAMLSLREVVSDEVTKAFPSELSDRATTLSTAFRDIVLAQAKIAAVNAFITWLYLGVALPLLGIHLPFAGTLVIVTFVAGMIPLVGNITSNTAIIIVSLGHSSQLAVASLVFLVVIHKLEYFLNARIIGSQIRAKAWELLTAMLVMEAAFGISGVVAAPIYYAYLKYELKKSGII